jgi:hypothetical protein
MVRDCWIEGNEYGVLGACAESVTVGHSVLKGNKRYQLAMGGAPRRVVRDFETGAKLDLRNRAWRIQRNRMKAERSNQGLVSTGRSPDFLDETVFRRNQWQPGPSKKPFAHARQTLSLKEWKRRIRASGSE